MLGLAVKDVKEYLSLHACMLSCFSCIWFFATIWTPLPPGSSVHGILRTRILEWVAMPSSRRSSQARGSSDLGLPHCRQVLYRMSHQGSPHGLCNKYMFVLEITPCSAYCCVARTLFEEHVFKTGILLLAYRSQMWSIPEISLNVHGEYYGKIILY